MTLPGIRRGHHGATTTAICVRVGCTEQVQFSAQHLPLFCSNKCRAIASRDRRWLKAEEERLRDAELRVEKGSVEEHSLWTRRRLIQWHLLRYSILDPDVRESVLG